MEDFLSKISLKINENIYLKDPETSDLGKKIIEGSISLIHELGFEQFTFKKLSAHIKSTEASIYRYFENKHKLLLYLTAWYWKWLESKIIFATMNIPDPTDRLTRAIKVITEKVVQDGSFEHIDEVKLQKIIISESSKVYFTKTVDKENREGVFSSYKQIVQRIADMILFYNKDYKYPNMLASTLLEGVYHQRYFAEHLPTLTNVEDDEDAVHVFYTSLVFKAINTK
jgi:AcrR family transcriptional regulator